VIISDIASLLYIKDRLNKGEVSIGVQRGGVVSGGNWLPLLGVGMVSIFTF